MTCEDCLVWTPAWVDREMEPELAGRFALHLEGCPRCSERVEAELSFVVGLRRRLPRPSLPDTEKVRLREMLGGAARAEGRKRRWGRTGRWALAAGLVLASSLAVRHIASRGTDGWPQAFRQDHLHHSTERDDLGIRSGAALEVAAWLQRQTGTPFHVPTMPDARLLGGRIARMDGKTVGLAVYESDGRRLSLFLGDRSVLCPSLPAPREGELVSRAGDPCSVVAWASQGHFHVAVSELPLPRLMELARQCQRPPT